jgi:hypothetical protein
MATIFLRIYARRGMTRGDARTLHKPGTRLQKTRRRGPNRGESSELRLTLVHDFSTSTRRATAANAVDDFRRFLDLCLPIHASRPLPALLPMKRRLPSSSETAKALKRRPVSFRFRPSPSRPSLSPPSLLRLILRRASVYSSVSARLESI